MFERIAIYSRVSSKTQDHASQMADLKAFAARQTGDIAWFTDTASGKNLERPGIAKLIEEIAASRVSTVVVWRLDRLGRTASGLTKLFDDLIRQKINLISLKDSLDLSTPAGRLMANVLASVAAFETEVRQERQLAGIAAAKAAGKVWGGSTRGRRLKVNKEQELLIHEMRADGKGITAIARTTGLSRPTIYRVLETHE